MNKPTISHIMTLLILSLMLIISATGCEGPSERADLKICLEGCGIAGSRTFTPEGSLEVSYYEITGIGPDGTSFHVTTSDSQHTVEGLLTGEWYVSAVGFSSEDVGLVEGDSIIILSKTEQSGTILMEEFYGTGDAQITVNWDDSQTISAEVRTYLSLFGSEETPELLSAASSSAGSVSYSLTSLDSGAYLLRSELYSDGQKVGGAIEILKIVNGKTTTGQFDLVFNDLLLGIDLTITDPSLPPVTGEISGIPMTVVADVPIEVSFTPDADSLQTGLECMWFYDSTYLSTGNPVQITFPEGSGRLDVIVSSSSHPGSAGAAFTNITAVESIPSGSPQLYREYSDDEVFKLDGLSDIAVLDDGLVITTSSNSDTVQTMRITNDDRLVVKQTLTHDGSTNLLDGASSIAVAGNEQVVAVCSATGKTISIYTHTTGSDTLVLTQTILSSATGPGGSYTITSLTEAAFSPDREYLYVATGSQNAILRFSKSTEGVYAFQETQTFSTTPAIDSIRSIDAGYTAVPFVSCVGYDSNTYHGFKIGTAGALSANYSLNSSNGWYGLSAARKVRHITDESFFTLSADTISEFVLSGSIIVSIDQSCRLKEYTHVATDFAPKDVCWDSLTESVYVVSSKGNSIISFDRDASTHTMSYLRATSTDTLEPTSCEVSSDDAYLLIGSASNDKLRLYKFAP